MSRGDDSKEESSSSASIEGVGEMSVAFETAE
jgi:hypothetical protein